MGSSVSSHDELRRVAETGIVFKHLLLSIIATVT